MKIIKYSILVLFFTIPLLLVTTNQTHAQLGQIWETIVGDPDNPEDPPDGGDRGSDEDLPVGIFRPPFSCRITYGGATYAGPIHVWEVDFNRKSCGQDRGDPIFASAPGTVRYVDKAGYGLVIISHKGGYETHYGHMRRIQVRKTEKVKLRQIIGEISNTSPDSIGPHLHYEQRRNGSQVKIRFNGKGHPASLPGNRNLSYCPYIGFVNCNVLY